MIPYRIGHGYDVHPLKEGRKLILGGVNVPYERGLDGHSDADVAIHALIDALLGAAGLGDIGKHFPPSDPTYKDIDSRILLRAAADALHRAGYLVGNADITIIAQAPKLSPHLPQMQKNIAADLDIVVGCVNLKATTEEHLGFTGAGEGIAAHAVCLIAHAE